jgi:hypothetical protein
MLPIEAMNVLGSLAGIGEIVRETFGGGDGKSPPTPRRPTVPPTGPATPPVSQGPTFRIERPQS